MRHFLQKYFPEWFPVERRKSFYNTLEVVRQNNGLVLNAPHANYSFGSLHEVFRNTFKQLQPDYQKIKTVLILGFGAGSVARILQAENRCPCRLTGVEIDEEIIVLAKKYFQFNNLKNLDLHISDAADFLSQETKQYDIIVVDLFLDHRTPEKFLTADFLKNLYRHLQPQGLVLYNYLLYDFKAQQDKKHLEEHFHKIFRNVRPLTFSKEPKNIVFAATK